MNNTQGIMSSAIAGKISEPKVYTVGEEVKAVTTSWGETYILANGRKANDGDTVLVLEVKEIKKAKVVLE